MTKTSLVNAYHWLGGRSKIAKIGVQSGKCVLIYCESFYSVLIPLLNFDRFHCDSYFLFLVNSYCPWVSEQNYQIYIFKNRTSVACVIEVFPAVTAPIHSSSRRFCSILWTNPVPSPWERRILLVHPHNRFYKDGVQRYLETRVGNWIRIEGVW